MRYLNRRFVSSAPPNPANIRIVHRRPRYIVGWMPRVKGNSPGFPSRSSSVFPARSRGVYHRFSSLSRAFRSSSARMNASEAFKRPRLIRWLRRRTRSSGLARLDDRLREALEGLLDIVAGLRGRVEDRAFVGPEDVRSVFRVHFPPRGQVRLVAEGVDGDRADRVADSVDPLRQVAERGLPGRVEDREDSLRAVEVRFLEQLEERALAHDVEDHHVDLDGAALHRAERDRLLGDDGAEGPDVGLVEGPGHEPVDEARLADALLANEADLELERLLLGLHGRLPHHGTRGTRAGGYQASGPIFSFRNGPARTLRYR